MGIKFVQSPDKKDTTSGLRIGALEKWWTDEVFNGKM